MKKKLTLLCVVCLLLLGLAVNAYATDAGTIAIVSTTADNGGTVQVSVTLSGASALDGVHFKIGYDKSAFEYTEEYTVGSQVSNESVEYNEGDSTYDYIDFMNTPKKKAEVMNGTLLTVTFNVADSADGDYTFIFDYDEDDVMFTLDESFVSHPLAPTMTTGKVSVKHTHSPDGEGTLVSAASCSANEVREYTCEYCKNTYEGEVAGSKLEHTEEKDTTNSIAATCAAAGTDVFKCSVCGEKIREAVVAKLDHTYGDWIIDKDATCTTAGSKHRVCSVCADATEGHTDTATIAVVPGAHKLIATEAKAATCTVDGNIAYWTCGECKKVYSDKEAKTEIKAEDTVVKGAHDLKSNNDKVEATTEATGHLETFKCSKCTKTFFYDDKNVLTELTDANATAVIVPVKTASTSGSSTSKGKAPKTGDETNIALWASLFVLCGAVAVATVSLKKKNHN